MITETLPYEDFSLVVEYIIEKMKCCSLSDSKQNQKHEGTVNFLHLFRISSHQKMAHRINNQKFMFVYSSEYAHLVMESILLKASQNFPEYFNTEKPEDVLKAIYKQSILDGVFGNNYRFQEDFLDYWIKGCFVAITDFQCSKILRLDLFRLIENPVFTGGLLHTYRHFKVNSRHLSANDEGGVELPLGFVGNIIEALFFGDLRANPKKKNKEGKQEVTRIINNDSFLFAFYQNQKCDVYYLDTVHRK